ncbi:MBL fold metallo-hydrolase [Acidobacteriota bacterium]
MTEIKNGLFRITLILLIAAILLSPSHAQDLSQVQIKTIAITEGIYMLEGGGGNIGVFAGEDGVLIIDSQFEELSDKVKAAIAEITSRKIRFVLNTNWHYDHVRGNVVYGKEGAVIFAHEKTLERMTSEQFHPDFNMTLPPYPKEALPQVTIPESMTIHFNGEDIHIRHIENAHSDADLVFFFKKANVLQTGDIIFTGGYPYIDAPSGGSIEGMIKAGKKILTVIDEKTKIIPGHGQPGTKVEVVKFVKMLSTVRDRIRKQIDEGKSLKEVVASKPTADLDEDFSQQLPADFFVMIVYNDLSGKYKKNNQIN